MDQQSLRIQSINIRKMPGLPWGIEILNDLSPQINIISGPNASGKTSIAQFIKKIIWPEKTPEIDAQSELMLGQENWNFFLEGSRASMQHRGINEQIKGLPPKEAKERYFLALHELVNTHEEDLAEKIIRESIGGYDLDKAAGELKYDGRIKKSNISEYKAFKEAGQEYRKNRQQQEQLLHEEKKLASFKNEKERALNAGSYQQLYQLLADYKEVETKVSAARKNLDSFPDVMKNLHGEEYKQVKEYREDIEQLRQAVQQAQNKIKGAREKIEDLNLPSEGIAQEKLDELDKKSTRLAEVRREWLELRKEQEDAGQQAKEALKSLENVDPQLDPESWQGIGLVDIQELDQFIHEAHQVVSEEHVRRKRLEELKEELGTDELPDQRRLTTGIDYLQKWLGAPRQGKIINKPFVFVLAIAAIILTTAATFTGWWMILAAIPVIGVLTYLSLKPNDQDRSDTATWQKEYEKLNLPPVGSWGPDEVQATLYRLVRKLQESEWSVKTQTVAADQKKVLEVLKNKRSTMEARYREYLEKIQVMPSFPDEKTPEHYAGMYFFIVRIMKWQEYQSRAAGLEQQIKETRLEGKQILKKINDILRQHQQEPVKDPEQSASASKQLQQQENLREQLIQEIRHQEGIITDKHSGIQKQEEKLSHIYRKTGLKPGDGDGLRSLTEKFQAFREASNQFEVVQKTASEKEKLLKDHSLFDTLEEPLKEMAADEASKKSEEYKLEAAGLTDIQDKISKLEHELSMAKEGRDLEESLHWLDNRRNDLQEVFEDNLSSITGDLIINRLKEDTRESSRPKVFHRANELLSSITNGRYQLTVDEHNNPSFRAFDTLHQRGQGLNELSTGTRVQLILAVRLAFIEEQEAAIRLPVIADELLANSDDERAAAIIEALAGISQEGRQVFYLTAQDDEVAKWAAFMKDHNIDGRFYRIVRQDRESPQIFMDTEIKPLRLIRDDLPDPEKHDHESYGQTVNVPAFNPLTEEVEKIHLWYLIEDLTLLNRILSRGIFYWGPLCHFLAKGGEIEGLDDPGKKWLKETTSVLDIYIKHYKQGRPLPIDRSALEESGAVSNNFMEPIVELLKEQFHNPVNLISALRAGEVRRFQTAKINELEAYLTEKKYIPSQNMMDQETLLAFIHAELSKTGVKEKDMEKLIGRVMG